MAVTGVLTRSSVRAGLPTIADTLSNLFSNLNNAAPSDDGGKSKQSGGGGGFMRVPPSVPTVDPLPHGG